MYFDYPLEQGLRLRKISRRSRFFMYLYFDYPLEQGLRPLVSTLSQNSGLYFDYPLEQGLRHAIQVNFAPT